MKIKTPVLVGVLLLALGVTAFAYQGVTHKALLFSPVLAAAVLAAGVVLVKIGTRKRPVF